MEVIRAAIYGMRVHEIHNTGQQSTWIRNFEAKQAAQMYIIMSIAPTRVPRLFISYSLSQQSLWIVHTFGKIIASKAVICQRFGSI